MISVNLDVFQHQQSRQHVESLTTLQMLVETFREQHGSFLIYIIP